ncbi:MAG: hypothetical protein U1F36_12325 [Planctomycetota bacterium]
MTSHELSRAHPALHLSEPEFHELMAEQLRRAPWVALSLALHAIALILLYLLPTRAQVKEENRVAVLPATEPVATPDEIVKPPEPDVLPVVDPTIDPVEVSDSNDADSEVMADATSETPTSPFDSSQWNTAVGLTGGAAGEYGDRFRRGRGPRGGGHAPEGHIQDALIWLARHQDEDGHWDADGFMKHDASGEPCDGPGNPVHDVGLTGLALLAFLGDGNTLRSGPYREQVKRGITWLREQQDMRTGLIGTPSSNEFVYDHAIATLAMVEAYGLSAYRLLHDNAQRAIDYLEFHRNPYRVWRYQPHDGDNDTSVTGWCLMAYASARYFGLTVNTAAIELGRTWLTEMTDPVTARCGYDQRGGASSRRAGEHATRFPRERNECMSAVALLCRIFLGDDPGKDKLMQRQADLVLSKKPTWNTTDGSIDQYAWYYGTYALYQIGGPRWKAWETALDTAVLKTQRQDANFKGSWDPAGVWGQDGGRVYSTAILCLTLQAYYRYTRLVH